MAQTYPGGKRSDRSPPAYQKNLEKISGRRCRIGAEVFVVGVSGRPPWAPPRRGAQARRRRVEGLQPQGRGTAVPRRRPTSVPRRVKVIDQPQGHRPDPAREQARRQAEAGSNVVRRPARASRRHRRRSAPADLHLLSPGAGDADPRGADAAYGRRSDRWRATPPRSPTWPAAATSWGVAPADPRARVGYRTDGGTVITGW